MTRRQLKTIGEVTAASNVGSCLRFDTLLKVHPDEPDTYLWQPWTNWGISLDPRDEEVARACTDGYATEWTETTDEHHASVAEGARRSGLGDSNRLMNTLMAREISGRINRGKERPNVIDIGCGPAGSTLALIDSVQQLSGFRPALDRVILLDPAGTVINATKAVGAVGNGAGEVNAIQGLVEDKLPEVDLSTINIVLMGASPHHMNVDFVLGELANRLPPGALLAIGEWCHGMLKSPAHCRLMMANLDVALEPGILAAFDQMFPTDQMEREQVMVEPPEELAAILTMAGGFWPNHARACRNMHIQPMFSPWEGHLPRDVWLHIFRKKFGFEVVRVQSLIEDNPVNTVFILRKPSA